VKDQVAVVVDFFSLKLFWTSTDIMFLLQKILTCCTLTFPVFLKKINKIDIGLLILYIMYIPFFINRFYLVYFQPVWQNAGF